MIAKFVKAWDANNPRLRAWFCETNQAELTYKHILAALIKLVINPATGDEWDNSKIHVIDDGEYQGTQIFIVPMETSLPSVRNYFMTYQEYGSCSGCDLLESIRVYDDGKPNPQQIKAYMTLALHLLQNCRYLTEHEHPEN